jgi:ketosteroid isomerase-like protein
VYVWTVNEPDVHISGDFAWIAYVNRGSIKDASGTENVTWLESAVLQKEKDAWRIRFLHSTRAVKEGG